MKNEGGGVFGGFDDHGRNDLAVMRSRMYQKIATFRCCHLCISRAFHQSIIYRVQMLGVILFAELLARTGMSVEKVGGDLACSASIVYRWERGEMAPNA